MRILDRFVARTLLLYYLTTSVVFTFLYLFAEALQKSWGDHVPGKMIMQYYVASIPDIFIQVLPIACVLATVLGFYVLNRKSELIALLSLGFGWLRLGAIASLIVLGFCGVSFLVLDSISPLAAKVKQEIVAFDKVSDHKFMASLRKDRLWFRSGNTLYSILNYRPEEKELVDLLLFQFNDSWKLDHQLHAPRAVFDGSEWRAMQADVIWVGDQNRSPRRARVDSFPLAINEKPQDFQGSQTQIKTMSLAKQWGFIQRNKRLAVPMASEETAFHQQLAALISPLILTLLAIPFVQVGRRVQTMGKGLTMTFAVALTYFVTNSLGTTLGDSGQLPPWIAGWMSSIIFLMLAVVLVLRRSQR